MKTDTAIESADPRSQLSPLGLVLILALLWAAGSAPAWGTWVSQTSGTPNSLRGVHFPGDALTGYAVGASGTILKTTDGGANWAAQTSGTTEVLRSVHFPVDANTGYAVGALGTILKTTDGGATPWVAQTSGTTEVLWDVHFPVDATTGYAVGTGGTILKTTDGGATPWGAQTSLTPEDLRGLHFVDADIGYAVGTGGTILKTTDGGATDWGTQTSPTGNHLWDVHFPVDATTGYAVGDSGTILKTTGGGLPWLAQTSGTGVLLAGVHFPVDATTGYVVGNVGTILKTTDGGATNWVAQTSPTAENLRAVHFPVDAATGYAVGGSGTILFGFFDPPTTGYFESNLPLVTPGVGWSVANLGGTPWFVPPNAVLEVLVRNSDPDISPFPLPFGNHSGGVRAVASTLERKIELHQADAATGSGFSYVTMHVQANGSSQIEYFAETTDISFVLLGYWTGGVAYEEEFKTIPATANFNEWKVENLAPEIGANEVAEVVITNKANFAPPDVGNFGRLAGVRTNIGLPMAGPARYVRIDNAASFKLGFQFGEGESTTTFSANADLNSDIEVYAEDGEITFYVVGSWTTPPGTYVELDTTLGSPTAVYPSWENRNLGALGTGPAVAEILIASSADRRTPHMGVRSVASLRDRTVQHHDAGVGGVPADPCCADDGQFARMHVATDPPFDIQWTSNNPLAADDHFFLAGYWTGLVVPTIDGDFSEWDDGIGNEFCIDDQGGRDDWFSTSRLDLTKVCIASNQVDTLYALIAVDDTTFSTASAFCTLLDTDDPDDGKINFVLCVVFDPPPGIQVQLYSCDNSLTDGCGDDTLIKTYDPSPPASEYAFSTTEPGVFSPDPFDTFAEIKVPYTDLSLTGGQILFSSFISYPGKSFLTNPRDSIFHNAGGQDYDSRIKYDLDKGTATTTPITLAWLRVEELGSGVRFEWMTATETANVGFNLYAVGDERLRRLNDEIIPSAVIDSLEPQRYSFEAWRAPEESFVLEDVDLLGVRRYHGPFVRGEVRGAKPKPERIAWGRIRDERVARQAARRGGGRGIGRVGRRGGAVSSGRPAWRPIDPRRRGWAEARLEVSEDGIYRVSYEQLLAAGVDLTGTPMGSLALTVGGEPVPIRVEEPRGFVLPGHGLRSAGGFIQKSYGGHSGGRFGPGAYIEFVGRAQDTLYTRTNVYTLEVDPRRALRVERERRPAPPWASVPASYVERLEVNRDHKYILTAPAEDPWYEAHLLAYGGSASGEFTAEVDGYAGGPAQLEVELWGLTAFPHNPDHHVELEWNGSWLGEERFDGQTVHRVRAELRDGQLSEGENRLSLRLPGDTGTAWDMVAFDRLWLSYARRFVPRQGRLRFVASGEAFEIEAVSGGEAVAYRLDGEVPVLLEGLSYLGDRVRFAGYRGPLPGVRGARARARVYEFAEIGALLVPGIAPWTEPVELVGPAELLVISHEEFLAGIQPLVDARRAEGWTVAVVDVAQVYAERSHGVVDPQALRDYIRFAQAEHGTEAVLLVGGDTYDYHDNLGVGSISFIPSLYVATDAVVRHAPVDPLYGDVDGDGVPDVAVGRLPVRTPDELASLVARILEYGEIGFAGTALLAADGYDVPAGYSFTAASNDLATGLPAGWEVERAYIDELGREEARAQLIQGINDGVALTSYFGHSGPTAWSFENLFSAADAAALENSGRPTVVTQWGCWNNYHVTPSYNTLAHKLLLSGDRGAAAVLGAATLTQAAAEHKLGKLLFAQLGRPGTTLGQALVEAKQTLAQTDPGLIDVILGWTLLGDPTLRIERAADDRDR